ncbi:MAG: DUF5667 domain-containing protein [Patescibacteria group bacterium]
MDYNNPFKKGIHDIKKLSLSTHEKESMLARLTQHTVNSPIKEALRSTWFTFAYKHTYALALAAVVVIIGGNISYAAAQSLPGDLLYPIKIHVNEKVQGVLKITPKATAKWEEKKIEKRLDEVNTLVEKGKFDSEKRIQVEKEVKKNVDTIRKQKNNSKNVNLSETVDVKLKKNQQNNEVKILEGKIQDELKSFKNKDTDEDKENKKEEKVKLKLDRQNLFEQSKHQE